MTNKGRTTQSLIRESSSKFWEDRPEGTERDPGAGGGGGGRHEDAGVRHGSVDSSTEEVWCQCDRPIERFHIPKLFFP